MACSGVEFGMHDFPCAPPIETGGMPWMCRLFGHKWGSFIPIEKQTTPNIVNLLRTCNRGICAAEQSGRRA